MSPVGWPDWPAYQDEFRFGLKYIRNFSPLSIILPHFYYCSSVWHFCGARDADKLEALNKRILRFILGDYSSPYNTLLSKVSSTSLCNKRIQNFLILLYKSLFFTHFPTYMKNMFSLRSSSYDLRGNYILSLSKPTAKQWNALPDFFSYQFFCRLEDQNTGCYLQTDSFRLTYLNLKLWIVNNIFLCAYYYFL